MSQREPTILQANHLGKLIELLLRRGYELIGPIERDGAIVYERIELVEELLPQVWTDEQEPGRYRLRESAGPTHCSATP